MENKKFIPEVNSILEYYMQVSFENCKQQEEAKEGDMIEHIPHVTQVIIVKPIYSEINEVLGHNAYTLSADDILTLAKEIEKLQSQSVKLPYNELPF